MQWKFNIIYLHVNITCLLLFLLVILFSRYKTLPESEEFDINVSISEPSLFNICPYDQRKPTHKGRPVYPLGRSTLR